MTLQTDLARWSNLASDATDQWEARNRVIGKFIRPSDAVLDLGAGRQTLRNHIPRTSSYLPVDCVNSIAGTFVVDFNREFRLPPANEFNVVVSSGFLEYINDQYGFMEQLVEHANGKFFVCSFFMKRSNRAIKRHCDAKPINLKECERFLKPYISGLTHIATVQSQPIFTGTLSAELDGDYRATPLNNMLKPQRHWAARLFSKQT